MIWLNSKNRISKKKFYRIDYSDFVDGKKYFLTSAWYDVAHVGVGLDVAAARDVNPLCDQSDISIFLQLLISFFPLNMSFGNKEEQTLTEILNSSPFPSFSADVAFVLSSSSFVLYFNSLSSLIHLQQQSLRTFEP